MFISCDAQCITGFFRSLTATWSETLRYKSGWDYARLHTCASDCAHGQTLMPPEDMYSISRVLWPKSTRFIRGKWQNYRRQSWVACSVGFCPRDVLAYL